MKTNLSFWSFIGVCKSKFMTTSVTYFWLFNTDVTKEVCSYIKEIYVSKNYETFAKEPLFLEVIKLFANLSSGCH